MALDMEVPYTAVQYKYNGHYAVLFRGLWMVENDFMAGPYEVDVGVDEEYQRVGYMMKNNIKYLIDYFVFSSLSL